MPSRQIVSQLLLLTCVPLYQSLPLSSHQSIKAFLNHNCGRSTVLFAGRNPFKRNESNVHDSAVEREKKLLTSTSALFSSPKSRGRSINFTRNEGTSSNDMHPEDVGAVRNASVLAGFLSIVFTRDIWYAVSSFLLINIFASQSNPVGVFIRSIGQRMDNLQAEISRKRMILRIVNFLKAVNEASLLDQSPSKQKEFIKRPPRSAKVGGGPDTPITVSSRDCETGNRSGRGRNYFYPVPSKSEELETDQSDRISDTHSSGIESSARSPERERNPATATEGVRDLDLDLIESYEATVTVTTSPFGGTHPLRNSLLDIDAIRSTIYKETPSIPETEHNSEAVIKATIEVQAAADAASARLKAWIIQQKQAEEEKKILKLSIVSEITRVRDLPRLRDELLMHMSTFVSGNISERKSLTVATANTTTATTANSLYPVFLTSFSCRAVESSAGSISDFILVLTSPGRNSLKQRYRELAKEFHPDCGTNLDLPDSTVNSLMANLTGAFNYLSGVNSLSPDGQTLMSAQSPWGLKYTGGTVFDQSDHIEVGSHTHDDNDDDDDDDDDNSEGGLDVITQHEAELELNLESGSKCGNMVGVLESMEKSLVAHAVSGDAGTGVKVEEEKEKEKEGEIDGEALSLIAVTVSHHPLPLSLIGLAVDHEGDDGGDDSGGYRSHRADGGSGDMGVKQLEGKIEINMKMKKNVDDIGCHQETSLNFLTPPLVASITYEVEKETETEMWTQLPPHAHYSDAHSDSAPSDHLSTPSMIKCEDQSMAGEEDSAHSEDISLQSSDNNCISFKANNDNSNIRKSERRNHESDSLIRNDDHNNTNDEPVIESKRLQKKVETSDFSSPYKTKQQVLMWKSWGKDIDWSKMKFQGNSEIYTKAQESLSKSSGRMMRNVARES